ncbi:MAG: ornithine carbamoyltransferase [Gammaproteobacteria bacterium]
MSTRHFLTLLDYSPDGLRALLARAIELKIMRDKGESYTPLKDKTLAMIFEKSSTRTRVSFETGMVQLGGHALFLSPRDTQFGRGEPIEDSARVLSRMVDGLMIRTFEHENLQKFAAHASIPVINGLTDLYHPCQLLADMQTWFEHRGDIRGATVAWIGDGNNMCHSYINASSLLGFQLNIACPQSYCPDANIVNQAKNKVMITDDVKQAVEGVDLIVTDVWASMGQEKEQDEREKVFQVFQVNSELLSLANKDALFMHCLPAHRGEEVTAEVIDGPQSVVWDEAENRLHAQKALMENLMS